MVLSTHIVFGSIGAQMLASNPVLGFGIGFASHFVLDAIPHWDYQLSSKSNNPENPLDTDMHLNKAFIKDLCKLGLDCLLGFIIVLTFFYQTNAAFGLTALTGAIGGVTPDFLQFIYFKWKKEPLLSLQKFHQWVHARIHFNQYPFLGFMVQASMVAIFLWLV